MIEIHDTIKQLDQYLQNNDFCGYDPYDGLNSELFKKSFLYKSPILRFLWKWKIFPRILEKIGIIS